MFSPHAYFLYHSTVQKIESPIDSFGNQPSSDIAFVLSSVKMGAS